MRWLTRSVAWSIPDFLRAGSRAGALLGAAAGAMLGIIVGIVWLALHPAEDDVVAALVLFALLLALAAAPIGPIVLEIARPKTIDAPRPYRPSVTVRLISLGINLTALSLLVFVSDAPLPATILIYLLVAWPVNRAVGTMLRRRHRRFIIEAHHLVCPNCEYSLANLTSRTCPECGASVDPDALQRAWREIYPARATG